ncbi:hypothetical protein QBC39DRAFT_368970 [Podospora conica]|nr:hypothetical protein QBC39DRAFT_368970 [Schizothecium conicum]
MELDMKPVFREATPWDYQQLSWILCNDRDHPFDQWRHAPFVGRFTISGNTLKWMLDPYNTKFIIIVRENRPRRAFKFFSCTDSSMRITAVAVLQRPQGDPRFQLSIPACGMIPDVLADGALLSLTQTADACAEWANTIEPNPRPIMHLHTIAIEYTDSNEGSFRLATNKMMAVAWEEAAFRNCLLTVATLGHITMAGESGKHMFLGHGFEGPHVCHWSEGAGDPPSLEFFAMVKTERFAEDKPVDGEPDPVPPKKRFRKVKAAWKMIFSFKETA